MFISLLTTWRSEKNMLLNVSNTTLCSLLGKWLISRSVVYAMSCIGDKLDDP